MRKHPLIKQLMSELGAVHCQLSFCKFGADVRVRFARLSFFASLSSFFSSLGGVLRIRSRVHQDRAFVSLIPFPSIPHHASHQPCHFHSIPFHSIPFQSIPFHSIPFHSIPFHSIPFHYNPYRTCSSSATFHSIPFHCIPLQSVQRVPVFGLNAFTFHHIQFHRITLQRVLIFGHGGVFCGNAPHALGDVVRGREWSVMSCNVTYCCVLHCNGMY